MGNQQPTTGQREKLVHLSGMALIGWAFGRRNFHFEPETPASGGAGDQQPPPQPPPPPRTYTEAEVQERLRGQAKELEKARQAQTELEKLRAEQAEANKKAAEKRGEYEKLYFSEKAKASDLETRLKAEQAEREGYEKLMGEETDRMLASVQDEPTRKRWDELTKGYPVRERRRILTELFATAGAGGEGPGQPPITQGGGPGRPKQPTDAELRKTREGRAILLQRRLDAKAKK